MEYQGNIKVEIDRNQKYPFGGYQVTMTTDWGGENFGIAELGSVLWHSYPKNEAVRRSEKNFDAVVMRPETLRTAYESFRGELIRLGLIPRPLVEDEVKDLRAQLADCQKTRDSLIAILDKLGHNSMLASIKTVEYRAEPSTNATYP